MKPASPTLIALFKTRQFYSADLYTITLIDGTINYYSAGDRDIIYGGNTYVCGGQNGAYFERGGNRPKSHWKVGTQVDTLQFDVIPGSATVKGIPFLVACQQGVFDGATILLQRAFMATYGDTAAGLVTVFFGRVAEVDLGRSIATFNVNSHLELLNQNMPRNVYQANCVNTLYDTSCTLLKSVFQVSGAVVGGSTVSVTNTNLMQATGYFDLGVITFTSGQNSGISRSVKTFVGGAPGVVNVLLPWLYVPAPGDTFTIYPGCDKTQNTCTTKFANLVNFRGMPYIPEVSTAV